MFGTILILSFQVSMQVSGSPVTQRDILNATKIVLYYSNDILEKSLPDLGAYISLGYHRRECHHDIPPNIINRCSYHFLMKPSSLIESLSEIGTAPVVAHFNHRAADFFSISRIWSEFG